MNDLLDYLSDMEDFFLVLPHTDYSHNEKLLLKSLSHNTSEKYERLHVINPDKTSSLYKKTLLKAYLNKQNCKKFLSGEIALNDFIEKVKNFLAEVDGLLTACEKNNPGENPGLLKEDGE